MSKQKHIYKKPTKKDEKSSINTLACTQKKQTKKQEVKNRTRTKQEQNMHTTLSAIRTIIIIRVVCRTYVCEAMVGSEKSAISRHDSTTCVNNNKIKRKSIST